jgi:hypothetical protein
MSALSRMAVLPIGTRVFIPRGWGGRRGTVLGLDAVVTDAGAGIFTGPPYLEMVSRDRLRVPRDQTPNPDHNQVVAAVLAGVSPEEAVAAHPKRAALVRASTPAPSAA